MFVKNNLFVGLLLGMAIPLITWFIFGYQFPQLQYRYKPGVPYLIAVALNLFIIRYCFRKDADQTGKGVMLTTFICMLLVFLFKVKL